jgi:MFS family permease
MCVQEAKGEQTSRPLDSVWSKDLVLLCCANLILFMGLYFLVPTLPLYLLKLGGAQRDVGFVMGGYTIAALFMTAIAGWLSDRYGRKKVMLSGLATMLAVSLLYWVADSVPSVALTRVLQGLAYGAAITAAAATVAAIVPVSHMARGIGYYTVTGTLAMGVAPIIGIWLAGRFGYSVLFAVVSSMMVVALLCSLPVRSVRVRARKNHSPIAQIVPNMLEKAALLPAVVTFFACLTTSALLYFIALYAAHLHIANGAGLFFAVYALFMVISRLSGRWADRGGSSKVILIGLLSMFAGIMAIVFSHTMIGFLLAGALYGIGNGFCLPTLQALAVRNVSADRHGAATGTYYVAMDMGVGVGAMVWGFVAQALGYRIMYLTASIPITLAGVIYYRFRGTARASS